MRTDAGAVDRSRLWRVGLLALVSTLLITFGISTGWAQDESARRTSGVATDREIPLGSGAETPALPLEQLLRADGSLDLTNGYRGSVSVEGWRMESGPDGVPRFERSIAEDMSRLPGSVGAGMAVEYSDAQWDDRFSLGLAGIPRALVSDGGGNLYAGGEFVTYGGSAPLYIAKWNGTSWSALGSGMNNYVFTLAIDGSGNLYAGGDFTTAGGVSANCIAKWNGTSWSALGSGMNGSTRALTCDGSGNVYAGGYFTTAGGVSANYIAKWNGTTWSALGSGMNYPVIALAVDGSGNLYAGGNFTSAGGVSANYIAKWNGTTWSALGSGVTNWVYALAFDGSGSLYAGGAFTTAGGVSANRIAKWSGTSWSALGSGMSSDVYTLAFDASGSLCAGGAFTTAGGASANRIAKWNGTTWSALGSGVNNFVYALAFDGIWNIYAGGSFTTAGVVYTTRIAEWNGSVWSALGQGMDAHVAALAYDGSGNLYAAGQFIAAGGVSANRIARWNGTTWSRLGSGMSGTTYPHVFALATDMSGILYAGGQFLTAGGVSASRIARWNGSTWSALGSGISAGFSNCYVECLAVDGSGNLYAGGAFTTAGGISANYIAKWNGTSWSALGSGMNSDVYALAFDGSGNLYAGGAFTTAGGVSANRIAKWNGTTWSALGSGVNNYVYDLAFDGIWNIYAGGAFTTAGDVSASRIARWNGTTWSALGSGITASFPNCYVRCLAFDGSGSLYAGGEFTTAGGAPAIGIAQWSGTTWSALGSGVFGASALVFDGSDDLCVGGGFDTAGSKCASKFTIWHTIPIPPAVVLVEPADSATVLAANVPFTWSDAGADYYELWSDDDADFSSPEISPYVLESMGWAQIPATSFSFGGSHLTPGTYSWKVRAYTGTSFVESPVWTFTYSPPVASAPVWGPLYRLYKPEDTDHFYCSSQHQQQIADNQGYRAERVEGFVSSALFDGPEMAYMFRFYDDARDCHYYTSRQDRVDSLIVANLRYEGITGYVYAHPDTGLVPLYHLSAPGRVDNLYTTRETEREYVVEDLDFTYEDILGWVSPTGDTSNIPANQFAGLVGAGISPGTGNLSHYTESDFAIPSTGLPLIFEHVYNSLGVYLLSEVQPLGPGWSHTYNAYILTIPNMWVVVWPDGSIHRYSQATGVCLDRDLGVYDTIEVLPAGKFEITKKDQVVYTFERPAEADPEVPSYLTSIRDRNQNAITCEYEPSGLRRLLRVNGSTGRQLQFMYADPDTLKRRYITAVQDIVGGRAITFAYADSNNNLTSYTDCDGDLTRYVYRPEYREDHQLKQVVLPRGNTITNTYAERRALGQSWNGSQITLTYATNQATVTDGEGTQTRYGFDAQQRVSDITDLTGGTGAVHFDRTDAANRALPTSILDRNGQTTTATYDDRGNALTITRPLGVSQSMTYSLQNDLLTYTDPRSNTTTYGYDSNGNLTSITEPMARTTTFVRLSNGLVDLVRDPMSRSTDLGYDQHGNMTGITDNLGNQTTYVYDSVGRLLREVDPEGYETIHTYDCAGQRLSTLDAATGMTNFYYDDNGNLIRVADPKGNPTVWTYNQLDLVESMTNAVGDAVAYSYREDGRLGSRTRPTGTTSYGYSGSGQLQTISSSSATLQRDANGNITGLADSHGNMSFTYDALNRLTATTDYDLKSVGYAYDAAGNLVVLTYAPGKVVTYTYYDDNSMHTVTDWLGHTTTYTYFADGALQSISYGNNTSATFGYDGAGRLQDLVHRKSDASIIASYHYDLDRRGNIITEDRQEPLGVPAVPAVNESYTYNAANRLLSVGSRTYGYDGAGNMTSRSGADPISCTYDLENRLTGISGSTNAIFVYDTFGNRRAATRDGVTTKYVLDVHGPMSQVLMETDAAGNPLAYYVYGVGLVSRTGPGATPDYGCYHFNQVGSIVAVSGQDGVTLTHRYSYSPFGEVLASDVPFPDRNPFRFGGWHGVIADSADLIFMRARYYDPVVGRFMSEDPVWDTNLFVYARNNPVALIDPSGATAVKAGCTPLASTDVLVGKKVVVAGASLANPIAGAALKVASFFKNAFKFGKAYQKFGSETSVEQEQLWHDAGPRISDVVMDIENLDRQNQIWKKNSRRAPCELGAPTVELILGDVSW